MVGSLLLIWLVAVVSFFVLWAILAKIVKRISDRKESKKDIES